jgi:putative SOS response-associated peptidase YedK
MCGRYLITSPPQALKELFGFVQLPNLPAQYNVAPTQPVPIVRHWQGQRDFALMRWGLIPAWVKDPKGFTLLINARGETAAEKPAFRNALRYRRCLFPADGFYEWKTEGGHRRPFALLPRERGPIAFAGLWETWAGPNGEEVDTAAIVTTQASADIAHIHHRMPVVIDPEDFDRWIDCMNVDYREATQLVAPAREGFFECVEVSNAVNKVANDTPDLLTPITDAQRAAETAPAPKREPAKRTVKAKAEEDSGQGSLF